MRFEPREPTSDENVNVSRSHPVGEALKLAVGLVLIAGGLFLFAGWIIEKALVRIPVHLEVQALQSLAGDPVGDHSAGEASRSGDGLSPTSGKGDLLQHPRLETAHHLVHRLADHLPSQSYRFRIELLEIDDVNAFALPGGVLVVTRALLDAVESENELAFVLGHELGHFQHRDHLRRLGRGAALRLGLAVLTGQILSAGPDGLARLAGQISGRTLDRSHEYAADELALELLHAEYGHVHGATHFLERLPKGGLGTVWLSTHPAGRDRVERLHDLAQENGWTRNGVLTPLPDEP